MSEAVVPSEGRVDHSQINLRRSEALGLFDKAISRKSSHVPADVAIITRNKIDEAYDSFLSPEKGKGTANSAFLIHSRRNDNSPAELDDIGRCLPALGQEFGIPYQTVDKIWNLLPPFEVGRISGKLINGIDINCALISVPITPAGLASGNGPTERVKYAQPKIESAIQLARKLGADTVGLGESLASLTGYGRRAQEKFPDIRLVTGHTGTTFLIDEWVNFAAAVEGKKLSEIAVTIVGADGGIGSTMTRMLAEKGVGGLILNDKESQVGRLKRRAEEIENEFSHLKGKIQIFGESGRNAACRAGDVIISAASAPEPFIKAEDLREGAIVIDDSQPPSVSREEADKAGAKLLWVVGETPLGISRDFDYGISGEWGCALEVIVAKALKDTSFLSTGPTQYEGVKKFRKAAAKLGIGIATPQSYGERVSLDSATHTLVK